MKKGILQKRLTLSHKNGNYIFRAGDEVPEDAVNDFNELVEKGILKVKEEPKKSNKKDTQKEK